MEFIDSDGNGGYHKYNNIEEYRWKLIGTSGWFDQLMSNIVCILYILFFVYIFLFFFLILVFDINLITYTEIFINWIINLFN